MHRYLTRPFAFFTLVTLSGCGVAHQDVARLENAPLTFHSQNDPAAELAAQADALKNMARDLVQRATLRGAATGAALGCGVAVVAGGDVTTCASKAVVGATAGALMGHRNGQKAVDTALAQQDVQRSLRGLRGQTDRVTGGLPEYLAAQDAAVAKLKSDFETGRLDAATYRKRLDVVRAERAAVTLALDEAASQMRLAAQTLDETSDKRAVDLDNEIKIARAVEEDIASARSSITLF